MSGTAIYISLLSLVVSAVTFYLTHMRPPKIDCIVGSTIGVNHQDDGFSIYIPLTFTNDAQRPGLVNRCSVVFSKPDSSLEAHYIEWTEFRKRNDDMKQYTREDFAGPLQIEGRSSLSKLAWYRWREGTLSFAEGRYVLEFFIWIEKEQRPSIQQKHEFFISAADSAELKDYKINNSNKIVWIGIDKQIESNRLLTEHEKRVLLG